MQPDPVIDFRRKRDFGDVINVTFAFLRQNLEPLGKCLLYIVGPFALITGLITVGLIQRFTFDAADPEAISDLYWMGFLVYYAGLMISGMLTWVMAISVVLGYIVLYQDREPGTFGVSEVWDMVARRFLRIFGTILALAAFAFAGYLLLVIPMVLTFMAGFSIGSALLGGLMFFFGFMGFFAVLVYFSVIYALIFPIQMRESLGFIEAIRRSHFLVNDHWWSTFFVLLLATVLMSVLGLLFNLPGYIISFMGGWHAVVDVDTSWLRYPLLVGMIFGTLGSSLLYAIPLVASAAQYFSLVEYKEQTGLMGRIDALGSVEEKEPGEENDAHFR